MAIHIVFVAKFGEDQIEVSHHLPECRQLTGYESHPVPVHLGYTLTRLRVEADEPPVLPEGDLTREEYTDWRAILSEFTEETVDPLLVTLGLGGICVEVQLEVVDYEEYGTSLVANVTNIGPYPAGALQVVWHGRWDQQAGSRLIGQGFYFVPVGKPPKEFHPGDSRQFALMKPDLQKALSFAAALSSDQFHIGVDASLLGETATHEIYMWAGKRMDHAIEALERFLATEDPR